MEKACLTYSMEATMASQYRLAHMYPSASYCASYHAYTKHRLRIVAIELNSRFVKVFPYALSPSATP